MMEIAIAPKHLIKATETKQNKNHISSQVLQYLKLLLQATVCSLQVCTQWKITKYTRKHSNMNECGQIHFVFNKRPMGLGKY